MRRNLRPFLVAVVPVLLALAGCVEPNDGSKIELLLGANVQVPGTDDNGNGQPPPGTHYEMYVARDGFAEKLLDFEVVPIVNPANPCMLEDQFAFVPYSGMNVQGLHVTKWRDKLYEIYIGADSEGGSQITTNEAGALYDAKVRADNLLKLQAMVKAVVSHDPGLTAQEEADFIASVETAAPIDDTDGATNAKRWQLCQAFFADHPDYYVGADRLITLPLNGLYYGVVEGIDPRNLGPIGGASLTVNAVFPDPAEQEWSLQINWQFNEETAATRDLACDYGAEGTPGETPEEPGDCWSPSGFHYMAGLPIVRTRDVINVPLANVNFSSITGEAAIYSGLNRDDVHF